MVDACPRQRSLLCAYLLTVCLGCQGDPSAVFIQQLNDPSVDVRRTAIAEMSRFQGEHVITALAKAVDDSDTFVRCIALEDLSRRGEPAMAQLATIERALDHADQDTSVAAALALLTLDPTNTTAIAALQQALLQERSEVFLRVGELGEQAAWAIPTLIKLLSSEQRQMRAISALTLGRIGPTAKAALQPLDKLIDDPEEAVSRMADMAIEQIEAKPGKQRVRDDLIPL